MEEGRNGLTDHELDHLIEERSLFGLYLASRQLPTRQSYYWGLAALFITTVAATLAADPERAEVVEQARKVSETAFGFAGTILGVVIGGFAIFSTIATSKVAKALATAKKVGKPSELKTIALHFVAAFIPFLVFIALHWAVVTFCWPNGPASKLVRLLPMNMQIVFAAIAFASICTFFAYLLIVLTFLVFNVYMSFMTMAGANVLLEEIEEEERRLEAARAEAERRGR